MDISLEWYNAERTILYLRLAGDWDIDESQRTIDAYKQRVREVPHPVDLIAEALDKTAMNPPVWVLRLGVNGIQTAPANAGLVIFVPNRTMLLALADAGIRLLGEHYRSRIFTASTFEQAHHLIEVLRKPRT